MWTLLRSLTEWEKYQQGTAQQLGITGTAVHWGSGPKEFPCLVSTYMPPVAAGLPPRLVSAYVYTSDAEALIRTSGATLSPTNKAAAETTVSEVQDNFNRWVTASLLALIRELREIGALKPIPFERSLAESLQLVDEVVTQKKDERRMDLEATDKALLDRLFPTG